MVIAKLADYRVESKRRNKSLKKVYDTRIHARTDDTLKFIRFLAHAKAQVNLLQSIESNTIFLLNQ